MPATLPDPCAVVSCHVERPLSDEAWARFSELQARRPGGIRVAALLRPADAAAGENEDVWAARAREAAERGPLGHHVHWTAPDHARPTSADAGARVRDEGRRLRELGVAPTCFCGGGWYTDLDVVEACAELGYVDCTPRARRPPYLRAGEPWAELAQPARVWLPSGRLLLAVPTTHSLGDLARALASRSLPRVVHVYLHDTDLLVRRRRALAYAVLRALALRRRPSDLDAVASACEDAPTVPWDAVHRPAS